MNVRFHEPFDANAYRILKEKSAKGKAGRATERFFVSPHGTGCGTTLSAKYTDMVNSGGEPSNTDPQRVSEVPTPSPSTITVQIEANSTSKDAEIITSDFEDQTPEVSWTGPSTIRATSPFQERAQFSPVIRSPRLAIYYTERHDVDAMSSNVTSLKGICHKTTAHAQATPAAAFNASVLDIGKNGATASPREYSKEGSSSLHNWHNPSPRRQAPLDSQSLGIPSIEGSLDITANLEPTSRRSSSWLPAADKFAVGDGSFSSKTNLEISGSASDEDVHDSIEVAPPDLGDHTAYVRAADDADGETPPGEWEALRIIGEERISGKLHYMIEWKPSLVSEGDAGNSTQLIREWNKRKARIQAGVQQRKRQKRMSRADNRAM